MCGNLRASVRTKALEPRRAFVAVWRSATQSQLEVDLGWNAAPTARVNLSAGGRSARRRADLLGARFSVRSGRGLA